tara:strand:+ start:2309 stop:2437 length:129 start_codon:yes stop_codon:yes gene_type:complete
MITETPTLKEIDRAMIRAMMNGEGFDVDLTPYINQIIKERTQ